MPPRNPHEPLRIQIHPQPHQPDGNDGKQDSAPDHEPSHPTWTRVGCWVPGWSGSEVARGAVAERGGEWTGKRSNGPAGSPPTTVSDVRALSRVATEDWEGLDRSGIGWPTSVMSEGRSEEVVEGPESRLAWDCIVASLGSEAPSSVKSRTTAVMLSTPPARFASAMRRSTAPCASPGVESRIVRICSSLTMPVSPSVHRRSPVPGPDIDGHLVHLDAAVHAECSREDAAVRVDLGLGLGASRRPSPCDGPACGLP